MFVRSSTDKIWYITAESEESATSVSHPKYLSSRLHRYTAQPPRRGSSLRKMASAIAGQGALCTLPSTRRSTGPIVASYELPPKLKAERKSLKDATATGIAVSKVTKVSASDMRRGSC